ncbi:exodeoxyribonuclease V subunit beta [Lonepinella sp. BR2271]|uniref:exodeoxyribonuclease V subunit beta n=1 Tax=Lonepinella sp. BR2271 TaxID=3434550 RepID=UPI003F6DF6AE
MLNTTALTLKSTPLTKTTLIEASAGTGKTYTMASLYIRLLLQVGEHNFSRPLSVEEILVVTFTEASTQELKERIRQRIHLSRKQLMAYQVTPDKAVFKDNQALAEVVDYIDDMDLAIQRLRLAEQNMDLASIYTIHGFCRRMLMQYAFHSGIQFELELVKDETLLLKRFANEVWRENFYSLPLVSTLFIQQHFISPHFVMFTEENGKRSGFNLSRYVGRDSLAVKHIPPALLRLSLADFLEQQLYPKLQQIQQLKEQWQKSAVEIRRLIEDELAKKYGKGENKRLKRANFKSNHVPNWLNQMESWANDDYQLDFPDCVKYFSQQNLNTIYVEEGAEPISHPLFSRVDEINNLDFTQEQNLILYHFLQALNQKITAYKLDHTEKGFNDLLRLLRDALRGEQGEELAQCIRQQYPFAMIDEFQDTDNQQYQIFAKIYQSQADCGFIMIGDPKQAIYKFRGADIFTYLQASQQAQQRFTLEKNYRSNGALIEAINQLFDFPNPFIYQDIAFHPVGEGSRQADFLFQGEKQAPFAFYLGAMQNDNKDESQILFAETCANAIAQWLKSADKNTAVFVKEAQQSKVQDNDIAVLVENWREAELIQQSLRKRGIASVYLSDKTNVFDSDEAVELSRILQACLHPQHTQRILNALSTSLFAFSASEINQIKQQDRLLEQWANRFELYRRSWLHQGVLAMLYQLFLYSDENQPSLLEKIKAMPNGERRVTNLLHLSELLQQATPKQESEASLLRWFELQIQNKQDRDDEQQLRLESENQLVKIVTIHKSKGLEYGLVWLPFIAFSAIKADQIKTYHDEQDKQEYWDIQEQQTAQTRQEQMAEKMRLLYVALTRAKYQVNIALPLTLREDWCAIGYALTQGEMGLNEKINTAYDSQMLLTDLQQKWGQDKLQITPIGELELSEKTELTAISPSDHLTPATFETEIERNWRVESFTGLLRNHQQNAGSSVKTPLSSGIHTESAVKNNFLFDGVKDNDQLVQAHELATLDRTTVWQDYPAQRAPVDFPYGAKVGTVLHSFLEKINFNQAVSPELAAKYCQRLGLDESWQAPFMQWISRILQTPLLADGFSLAQLAPKDGLKELQFYFNLHRTFDVKAFNHALEKHHPYWQNPWQFDEIQGMLRGFIDLVFRYQGKYYIVDYKSNLLGKSPQDYQPDQLVKIMQQEHYDLQYVLYVLALNRYLRLRDPDYDYETHFGGVIYTFLRGMNGETTSGVFFDRPKADLISTLEALFHA